ncbi:hypothetical protein [Proteiniphilum saccharofermentans]|uniref:hypothetical protein n=1 Tax=Proteiniphilum saccharofermentans TaxID=1642647 RepID=UPI0028AE6CA8|nr:hypothetical protein [Proteiniphilum saccharofermentans]
MKIKFLIAAEEHLEDIYNSIAGTNEHAAVRLYNDFLDEIGGYSIYIAAIWDCRQDPRTNRKKIK